MERQKAFNLAYLIAYKAVIWFFGFGVVMTYIWTQNSSLLGISLFWGYLLASVTLFLIPKISKMAGQILIYAIALFHLMVPCPFFEKGFFEGGLSHILLKTLLHLFFYVPFVAFLLYYDLRISLPKYRNAVRGGQAPTSAS
jgi:hypothetical protein